MRVTAFFLFAALFTASFEKVHWEVGLTVRLADVLALLFVLAFVVERIGSSDGRLPRTSFVLFGFLAAFLLVYLAGFYALETKPAVSQFGKGLFTFLIHFGFLIAGAAYLARRGEAAYWRALAWFLGGIACNALYGLLQLGLAQAGGDLDHLVLSPLTGGASSINIYGAVNGANVYRPNALTGDPNHLGIALLIPLLVLTPIYLRLEPGHRRRNRLAVLLGFLLLMELATLSRSGLVGLFAGVLVLLIPYRRALVSKRVLVPLGAVAALVAAVVLQRLSFFETVLRSRAQASSAAASVHFGVYSFIPDILHTHPLLGLGFNNFSVYYEFVTGLADWGPHSFYVALLVETGVVGAAVFAVFLGYLFVRLHTARDIGRALQRLGDPISARVRPLAWGLTAALVATMAANAFYLTMTLAYFFAFELVILAAPVVFARRLDAA